MFAEIGARPFRFAGEGEGRRRNQAFPLAEARPYRLGGGVGVARRGAERAQRDFEVRPRPQRHEVDDLHPPFGECAGFVQTKRVGPREHLDGVQILHQHALAGELDDAQRQRAARQQHQALRNHIDERGGRAENRSRQIMRDRIFLEEQRDAERQNDDGHNFDDPLEPRENLAGFLFDVLCARGNPGNVIPVRDAVGPRAAGARDDEAAGQKQVARLFEHRVRLAGDERLVDLALAGKDDAVGADLAAVGKDQHVVQHHLVDGQRKLFTVADDRHLRLREEGELVDHALGADFLKDADGGVAEYNADEQSVFIGADRQHGDGQQQIDDVEQRQQVVAEDARVGL